MKMKPGFIRGFEGAGILGSEKSLPASIHPAAAMIRKKKTGTFRWPGLL
jgi:hypothetical protein